MAGSTAGEAVFQTTTSRVTFEVTLEGEDGRYALAIEDGSCGTAMTPWTSLGTLDIANGIGTLTGERDDFAISSSHDDGVIGRLLVARRVLVAASCGEIESD